MFVSSSLIGSLLEHSFCQWSAIPNSRLDTGFQKRASEHGKSLLLHCCLKPFPAPNPTFGTPFDIIYEAQRNFTAGVVTVTNTLPSSQWHRRLKQWFNCLE